MVSIPNLDKLIRDANAWKVSKYSEMIGNKKTWHRKGARTQHTIPDDKDLLKKIGINKNDKILTLAGYYGDWTNAIAIAGCKVTYSEISKDLVLFAKKKFGKNKNIIKFICSDYVKIPKNTLEYDWSVSFEPIGGKQGLPIAVMRGLLNRKGIKIIHYPRDNKPLKSYLQLKLIKKIYNCTFKRKCIFIKGINQKNIILNKKHIITTLATNSTCRKTIAADIKALETNEYSKESLKRLSEIGKLMDRRFLKNV